MSKEQYVPRLKDHYQSVVIKKMQEQFGKTFVEIAELSVELVARCIKKVHLPDKDSEPIVEYQDIYDWLKIITKKD